MTRLFRAMFLLVCLLAPLAVSATVQVQALRLSAGTDGTRVVMELSEPTDHRIFALRDPDRIVVDLTGAEIGAAKMPAGDGVVTRIRSGKRDGGTLRLVFDLESGAVQPRSIILPPSGSKGHRLVVDLFPKGSQATKPVAVIESSQRDVLIAIDPGHGGVDPGAIGRNGTREKDVVLQISRLLAEKIDAQPGMRSFLTRNTDDFLSHRERMKRARDQRADFFISIHADAFKDGRARGSSVYALSARGATSEAARWLAERENAADLIGGVSLDDKDDMLASVLLDLSQNAAISASLSAGSLVLEELSQINNLHRQHVQQAGFLVLKSPDIPSLLVETAFISNAAEERRLLDPNYQDQLASSLMRGVRNYFLRNAPPDTRLAQLKDRQGKSAYEHVIGRGETLSEIAERYQVNLNHLRQTNGLRGDRISVGQVLAIPLNP